MTYHINRTQARGRARADLNIFDEVSFLMRKVIQDAEDGQYQTVVKNDTLMTYDNGLMFKGTKMTGYGNLVRDVTVTGDIVDPRLPRVKYQWQISDDDRVTDLWENILINANNVNYTPLPAQEGKFLRVNIIYRDSFGPKTITSISREIKNVSGEDFAFTSSTIGEALLENVPKTRANFIFNATTSKDDEFPIFTFEMKDDDDSNLFIIDSDGMVSFNETTTPNFEVKSSYTFTIKAELTINNELVIIRQTITIPVDDADDDGILGTFGTPRIDVPISAPFLRDDDGILPQAEEATADPATDPIVLPFSIIIGGYNIDLGRDPIDLSEIIIAINKRFTADLVIAEGKVLTEHKDYQKIIASKSADNKLIITYKFYIDGPEISGNNRIFVISAELGFPTIEIEREINSNLNENEINSINYYNAWKGNSDINARALSDQLNQVLFYFRNLGYDIEIQDNTFNSFKWVINY